MSSKDPKKDGKNMEPEKMGTMGTHNGGTVAILGEDEAQCLSSSSH